MALIYSACRERSFPNCGRGFLRDQDPLTRSQIRKRTRPQTTSSASFFQTASQSSVRIPSKPSNQSTSSSYRPLSTHCSLFIAASVTHPPRLTFQTLSHQPSGAASCRTGMLVVPRRSCSCLDGSSSITGSSCNVATFSAALSACLALIRRLLISS